MAFNHESDKLSEALGLTPDEFEEINFKATLIVKKDLNRSRSMEESIAWAKTRFKTAATREIALLLMGGVLERGLTVRDTAKMVSEIREGLREGIRNGMRGALRFKTEEECKAFMEEFKKLAADYGGKDTGIADGMIAIDFENEELKNEFHSKIDELKKKYNAVESEVSNDESDDAGDFGPDTKNPFMWNFGPAAEA